ncbi:hypothetical protein BOX15_Mlig015421g1 [Macrostomum lignano]|uniref:Beta-hexosaminidase bacterial type N-terminal domain-containing protein n=1 Tax=Macrostomum lignano TaxID=282301 RepID=A0A267EVT7_9PLAT|nr:hypothetical protein BOX15_Mlig015421g1 [Macrostomum lignano]
MDSSLESLFLQMKKCIVECRSDILRVMLSTVESADQEKLQKLMQYTTNEGSLLHIACQQKMLDGIRILLNTGIDPRLLNESQKTALADANFHPDILAVFLQHCIQLISQADTEGLVRMLQIGISVNSLDRTDSQQNTLLHWACHFAQPACVRLLLERSANPNVANRDGVTPLHLCLIKADLELVRLLIQYGANPSVYVKQGPYADKNGFDLCSLSDKSVQLMQLISQQHHQQSQHQLYSQPTQMSAASSTSPSVANGSDSGATAAAASAVAVPADEARARPMNGSDFAKDSVLDRAFWPRPQQSQLLIGQHFRLPVGQQQQQPLVLSLNHQDGEPALHWLAGRLAQFRPRTLVVAKPVQGVSLEIGHRVCRGRPEGYYLEVTSSGIRLLAADARGLFNGAAVLSSLLTVCAEISMGLVPGIRVWDWPTTLVRGVLVDCSSGLLPRPEALISVAESAACMRANQLHLFFRLGSTAHACPYAQEDLRRVVRSAQELCLTPVLAIDIGIAVSDLTQVQSQADVLLGAFPPNCPLHLGPRLSAHLAQGPEQEAPVWLGLGRQHLYLASSGFSLPPWLQKLPITCIDHCLPRDRPEDRATYLHSALPEFVLAPATGAWLSFTGCHSLQRTRLCPGLAKSLTSLPGLSGVVSCDWDGGGIGPHLLTSLPVHAVTLGLAWNPAVLNNGAADDSSAVAGAASRWLPEPLAKLEPAESAVSQADKPSPFQALFCGLLPDQEIELRPVPKLHLKSPGEGTPEERLIGFTAELALLCYHMLAKPMASPAQRTDCANRVIKLKQAARPAWAGVYLSTQHLNTALATFDTLVSRLLNSVDLPDI